jgi:hypothetical protein
MKEIKLTQGKVAIVDDDDFEHLNQLKWNATKVKSGKYYARHCVWVDKKVKAVLMHRLIMNCPKNMCIDHINHNELDNQKTNLRICTHAENKRNRSAFGVSKYLGVSWCSGKFVAIIYANKKQKYLGRFINEKDAATAYNKAAKEYHGKFANLNVL